MRVRRQVAAPSHVQFGKRLTDVPLGLGLESVEELQDELLQYTDVILGREAPPVDSPYLSMMEVSAAYYARAKEIEMLIHAGEQEKLIIKGSPHYRFRTGQLRSFIEMTKMLADLGSRRLTQENLLAEQRYDGGA